MAYGGPRLYRFYNYEQLHYIPAPTGGWNPDTIPWELPSNQAAQLDNFLIRPGNIVPRGSFSQWADLSSAPQTPLNAAGVVWATDDTAIVSQKVVSSTAFIDPWNAPIIRPTAAASLATVGNQPLYIAKGGSPVPGGPLAAIFSASMPGPRSIVFDGRIYSLTYGTGASGAVHDSGSNYFVPATQLIYWGSFNTGNSFYPLGDGAGAAPSAAVDLRGHLSRIFLLGGVDVPGGGTTFSPTTIFYTNPIAGGGGVSLADWKDPVSGLTNAIKMDNDNFDPGIALASVLNGLLILRYSSTWILRGSTSASFTLQRVSNHVGCIDARSVVEVDNGAFFLSQEGLMQTDGVRIQNISGPVKETLSRAILAYTNSVRSGFGGYATAGLVSNGAILISIGLADTTANAPNGHIKPIWCAMFDPSTGAWVRITSPIWASDGTIVTVGNNYPGWVLPRSVGQLYTIGDKYITQLEDVRIGQSFVRQPGLYDKLGSGGAQYSPIPAVWKSAFIPLTVQGKLGQAKRFFLDHQFAATGLTPATGWSVQPNDATGASLGGALAAAVGAAPTVSGSVSGITPVPAASILHQNQDFTNEINDLGFTISWSDVARSADVSNVVAELYGLGVEFQRARELR